MNDANLKTSIKTLLFTFGPIILPRLIAFIQSIRHSHASSSSSPIQTLTRRQSIALNILFTFALVTLSISLIPSLTPENIFKLTGSRLQTPTNVLFTRLASHRPLTARDEALRAKFVSLDSRLLYAMLGPDVLADCLFCSSSGNDGQSSRTSYIGYALPSLLAPHLLHLAILGLVTSAPLLGRQQAGTWRNHAAVVGVALAAVDVWLLSSYEPTGNARATRLADVDFFYWKMRVVRLLCLAGVDAAFGLGIWLTATGRWRVDGDDKAGVLERVERVAGVTEAAGSKMAAVGALRNAICRDPGLRERWVGYWVEEEAVMRQVYEDREVVDAVKSALGRVDVDAVTRQAGQYAESILSPWDRDELGVK